METGQEKTYPGHNIMSVLTEPASGLSPHILIEKESHLVTVAM